MTRPVRWILTTVGALVLVAVGALTAASMLTDRSQWARVVMWRDADVGDRDRFPARLIAHVPGDTWAFAQPRDGSEYDRLWAPLRHRTAEGERTAPFDTFLAARGTHAFLVLLGDTLLTERYYHGATAESVFTSFSAAKSLLSLLVGLAIANGAMAGEDVPVTTWVPELVDRDPRFAAITLRHLMTMSSGLAFDHDPQWRDPARTYYAPDLRRVAVTPRWSESPGTVFRYNNYNPLLVGLALERATDMSVSAYLETHLWRRIGAAGPASWSLDSERHGFEKMESGFNARAADYARLGRLMLQGGRRDGVQILPDTWIARSTGVDGVGDPNPRYQYFWWTTAVDTMPAPFWAEGRFGQFIWIAPRDGLVIVRLGPDDGDVNWPSVFTALATRLRGDTP